MKTYIEQETRLMSVEELICAAGGKQKEAGLGLFQEAVDFEAFLNTLSAGKRRIIEAGVELYKRSRESLCNVITESTAAYNLLREKIADLNHEEFWLITLNQAARVISRRRISAGGIDQTAVDIRLIIKYALQDNATQIMVAHNHPSGNVRPSQADKTLTERIWKAANIMNIRMTDHIIIGEDKYFSFHDQGLI